MAAQRQEAEPHLVLLIDGAWSGISTCGRCREVNIVPDAVDLAHAIAHVDIWDGCEATIVARPDPPAVAALGYLTSDVRASLAGLAWQIRDLLPRTRSVGYAAVEDLVEKLAGKVIADFGSDFVRSARFTAIPRGGVVVLGLLSYALDLQPRQFQLQRGDGRPLMVVDDIAVTGHRIAEFMPGVPDREVVFAHLLSHPELRLAIETQKQRVIACVAAEDLHDHAPAHLGGGYEGWKSENSALDRFWIGLPDHVVTPWSEPDVGLWHSSPREARLGIRLAGTTTLKHRWRDFDPFVPVQVQPRGSGPLEPDARAIFGQVGDDVLLGRSDGGPVIRLGRLGAALWMSILKEGTLEGALENFAVNEHEELEDLVWQLTEMGLLTSAASGLDR